MSERDLVSKLLRDLRALPKSWWYKIPDPTPCPKCGTQGIASKRPFDIFGVCDGLPFAIEVKTEKAWNLKKEKCLAPHQLAQLQLFANAQGEAIVAVGEDTCYTIYGHGANCKFVQRYSLIETVRHLTSHAV